MSYTDMLEALEKTFDSNIQKVRRKMLFGDTGETLSVPSLSGYSGIGKTSSVKEFAGNKEFRLITIDCSCEPANLLVIHLNNAIGDINSSKHKGCVLLLDNINEADEEYLDIIRQYRTNSLDSFMEAAVAGDDGKLIRQKFKVLHDKIPENVFIVGEQRDY